MALAQRFRGAAEMLAKSESELENIGKSVKPI